MTSFLARPKPPARSESGYALLLVFLLAAMMAVALYNELPRVAFEAQRAKEQLLVERGEQYKRAIQIFVRKVGRYPATIDELESLNNTRFLRKRYLDPMTGKEKWRLIHINAGVLTDSVIPKNKAVPGQTQQAYANTFIGEGPGMGAPNNSGQAQVNPAMQRRASDDRPVIAEERPDAPDAPTAPDSDEDNPAAENVAATDKPAPPIPNPVQASNAGAPAGGAQNGGQWTGGSVYLTPAGQSSSGGVYVAPSFGQATPPDPVQMERMLHGDFQPPGFARKPADMGTAQTTVGAPPPGSAQPASGAGQSGFSAVSSGLAGQDPIAGSAAISPANGAGLQPQMAPPGMGGAQFGGGIAGVASESTGPAIKTYNQRKKYNEWEFVYDQNQDRGLAGVQHNGGAPGAPAQAMGNTPGQPPGMGTPGGSSAFGSPTANGVSNGLVSGPAGYGSVTSQPTQPTTQAPQN